MAKTFSDNALEFRSPPRILVVRSDRLGDVVLSTPVFEAIRRNYPKANLTVLVQSNVIPVLKGLSSVDHFMVFEPKGRHAGVRGFFRLFWELRRRDFRIAVVLQTHWKIAAALFLARVRYRVGPWSKFYSFLFFNRGVRQRRSHVEMHETDYNLQLLHKIGIHVPSRSVPTQISINPEIEQKARHELQQKGWDPTKTLILIHPGMGGSALNWPEAHYVELIRSLIETNRQVLVTGGPTEAKLLERIGVALEVIRHRIFFFCAKPEDPVDYLAALCKLSDLVVAPSTGPLHLAVALGKRVVTFYPPIRVQSAVRWGPYLSDESKASVLVPEVYCGQDFKCLGNLCNYFPCMKSIMVKQALRQVEIQLAPGNDLGARGKP